MGDLLNKIKWQLYLRFSKDGGILKKVKNRLSLKEIKDGDLKYYFYDYHAIKSNIILWIKGYYGIDEKSIDTFFSFLLNKYINSDRYLSFDKIVLPLPESSDRLTYRYELLDLILPYMLEDVSNFDKLPFNEGPYEYGQVLVNKSDIVIDAGANFGMFSAYASSKGAYVHAFEPSSEVIDKYLTRTASLNPNIEVHPVALSNFNGSSFFERNGNDIGGSKLSNEVTSQEVEVTKLDDFIGVRKIRRVDFIKADIEGAEYDLLLGAKEVIKEYQPKLAICTYHKLNDLRMLRDLILSINPEYEVEQHYKKIYAISKKRIS